MNDGLQRLWELTKSSLDWLKVLENSSAVMAIAAVVGVIVTVFVRFKNRSPDPSPLGGEVRLTLDEYEKRLKQREQEVMERLSNATDKERIELKNAITEIQRQLADTEAAYEEAQTKIHELTTALEAFSGTVSDERLMMAQAALAAGDFSKADTLLAEIEASAEKEVERASEAAFQRGEVAAIEVRWGDAAAHYDKAARLSPTYRHLRKAAGFAWRAGRYHEALGHGRALEASARGSYGQTSPELSAALNQQALILGDMGRYKEAESLYRQALAIGRETLGERHPDFAACLNNLAGLLKNTSRYDEAEPLFRQALEIDRETLGELHPNFAACLNNLASLLKATNRYDEAEPLYRQALEIGRETLGERHPGFATRLNNLAGLLEATGRYDEAEPLYRQALEIDRETLGERHPGFATSLNNLASLLEDTDRYDEAEPLYRQALEIVRGALGDAHPDTRRVAGNYALLLRTRFPDSPVLMELRAVFGDGMEER